MRMPLPGPFFFRSLSYLPAFNPIFLLDNDNPFSSWYITIQKQWLIIFMKELAAGLPLESSALFILVRKVAPERVLEELKGAGGKVLKTSLTHEDEAKLQAALSAAK